MTESEGLTHDVVPLPCVTFAGELDALGEVGEQVTGAKRGVGRVTLGQSAAHLGVGAINAQCTIGCEEREFFGHVVLQGQHFF